jgi:hypothetical protein
MRVSKSKASTHPIEEWELLYGSRLSRCMKASLISSTYTEDQKAFDDMTCGQKQTVVQNACIFKNLAHDCSKDIYTYILYLTFSFLSFFYTTQIYWYTVFELNIFQSAAAFTDRNINQIYSRSTQFLNSLQNRHTTFHTSQWAHSWLWGHNALLIGWNVTEADGKAGYWLCKRHWKQIRSFHSTTLIKVKVSRIRPGVAWYGTWRWWGCQPHAPAAFAPRNEKTPGPWNGWKEMSLKYPMTAPGIDPRTVRLVAQLLNHYATPGPSSTLRSGIKCYTATYTGVLTLNGN